MTVKRIIKFFDKLEDEVRGKLSRNPFLYALLGGIGVVLFWRGIWHIADDINLGSGISLIIGSVILLMTGVFVSEFIGSKMIISGLTSEEKLTEKEEKELKTEEIQIQNLQNTLEKLEKKIDHMETHLETEEENK